ncbi:MAG: MmcQ/YjbR family DNA-binding protein [Planctomycetes bacterium]|nr:MmcQ/YjbR family DNA-binding protein [Planctomycetota bacterium]
MSIAQCTKSEAAKRRAAIFDLVKELPEGAARAHGRHLSLEVRGKRFGWYLEDHHGDGRMALNCKARRGVSQTLANANPERFHIPKYVGHHGWVGLWLDLPEIDWAEVAGVLADAYRTTAPKSLLALI